MDSNFLGLPILPTEGVAGIRIGEDSQTVLTRLGQPRRSRAGAEGFEFLEYPGVTVCLEHGRVCEVVAEDGYRGTTSRGLKVGATWKELRQLYPTIAFDEDERVWYVPGIDGLSFDIVRPPRAEEQPIIPPWVNEEYEILDPEHAFVLSIAVHDIHYGPPHAKG